MNIRLNLSHAFINKQTVASIEARYCKNHKTLDTCWAFGSTFKPATVSLAAFDEHRRSGKAWTLHAFKGNRRIGSEWVSAQALALDLDECPLTAPELAALPFIRDHAHSVEPSPSNTAEKPKTRIIFVLSEPVTQGEAWKALQIALMTHFADLHPDVKCKDLARLFYGSTQPGGITLGNILDLKLAGGLIQPLAELENFERDERIKNPPVRIEATSDKAQRIVYRRFNRALDELTAASTDRHDKLIKTAAYLFGHVNGGWPLTAAEVERGLVDACARNGYLSKVGEHEITRCINDMRGAAGIPLEVHESKTSRQSATKGRRIDGTKTASPGACTIQADLILNDRYISNHQDKMPASGVIALISGMDTGKSETPILATQPGESLMIVSPLVTLTRNASNRFSKRFPVENYENIDSPAQRALVKRLAICLPSLERFSSLPADDLPAPDVLVLDELSKQLEQLGSDIYKNGEAPRTLAVLESMIKRAKRVYVTDAYMGQIEIDWLKSIRPDVFVVVNTYRRQFGRMVTYRDYADVLGAIERAIADDQGTVAIQSNSKAEVERLTAYFGQIYGKDAVLSIHSGNSTNATQKAFIATITANSTEAERKAAAAELAKYRVVLGSPSILTGIDAQSAIYRTFGIFYNRHGDEIDAPGCLQMLARYRNPAETHVWVQQSERTLKVSADSIYDEYREKARGTAILCALSEDGADFDGMNKRLLRLQAELLARRNRSLNGLYQHFMALAADNYTIEFADDDLTHGNTNAVIEAAQVVKAQLKETTLDPMLEAITPEMHQDKSRRGIRTDRDNAALQKWFIERTYRQPVTEQLYDLYRDGQGGSELKTFIDVLIKGESELKERDVHQIADGTPYMQRKHFAKRARTIKSVLLAVWGHRDNFISDHVLTAEGVVSALQNLSDELHHDLTLYCGHRRDYSENPVNIVKHVCRLMGLKLRKDRMPAIEGSTATYRLEADSLELMTMLAKTRLDAIAAEENERTEDAQSTDQRHNTFTKIRSKEAYTPDFCEDTPCNIVSSRQCLTPPGTGWRHVETPALNREIAFVPSGTGASKINPFSVGA